MLVHAEVMRDLVPDRIFHYFLQVLRIRGRLFDRFLENRNFVGKNSGIVDSPFSPRHAFVQAEQTPAAAQAELYFLLRGRFVLYNDGDIIQQIQKFFGYRRNPRVHQFFKFLSGHIFIFKSNKNRSCFVRFLLRTFFYFSFVFYIFIHYLSKLSLSFNFSNCALDKGYGVPPP